MLKLMIVDDEAIIRNGIASVIDWNELGIELVGEAANGRDALSRALVLRPDIVITDIKMPLINGLDFSHALLEKRPDTKIVLLTGYSDYAYMQQAIRLGAVDYLLKPIRVEELEKLMKRLTGEIRRNQEEKMRQIAAQKVLSRNLPIMRGNCLRDYATGNLTLDTFMERAGDLNLALEGPYYACVVLDIDDWNHVGLENKEKFLRYSILNMAEELLTGQGAASFGYRKDESSLIGVVSTQTESPDDMVEACHQVQFYAQRFFRVTVTAAIGPVVSRLEEINSSVTAAQQIMNRKIYEGKNQVLLAGRESTAPKGNALLLKRKDEDALTEALSMNKNLSVQHTIDHVFAEYFENRTYSRKEIQQFCIMLMLPAFRALAEGEISQREAFGVVSVTDEIERYETLDEMRMYVKNLYTSALRALEESKGSNYRHTIRDSIEYIKAHYTENIQVADVAAAVYVSPNYFSKIFKKETGESFTEWLNKYRIEKAKAMILQTSGDKVYEIAAKVGFNDYKYFAFIFKKYVGYTPSTFKELQR